MQNIKNSRDYSLPKTPNTLQLLKHNNALIDFRIVVCHHIVSNIKHDYGVIYYMSINGHQKIQTQLLTNIGPIKPKKLQNYEIKAYQNIDDLWANIANENNYNHFVEIFTKAIIQANKTTKIMQ